MKKPKKQKKAVAEAGEVVKFDEAGMPQLDVWLEDETIWLTQKQMGLLFGCAPQNITYHLHEIYNIGELEAVSTCKDFLQVQIEGGRSISRIRSCPLCRRTASRSGLIHDHFQRRIGGTVSNEC